jgi:hypothetical protein
MQQVLKVNDVTVKEMTVEVKVIRIGKKQMTQSVFRQLPEESVITPRTGELQGEVCGRVNYHVGCEGIEEHFHVIWQKGRELRRGIAFLPWNKMDRSQCFPWSFYDSVMGQLHKRYFLYLAAKSVAGWEPSDLNWAVGDPIDWTVASTRLLDYVDLHALERFWRNRDKGAYDELFWRVKEIGRSLLDERPLLVEGTAYEDMVDIVEEAKPTMMKWRQSYDQLVQLDQLFIAV